MFGESLIVYHGLFIYDKSVYKEQKANYNIERIMINLDFVDFKQKMASKLR